MMRAGNIGGRAWGRESVVPKNKAEGIDSGQLKTIHRLLQFMTNEELLHGRVLPLFLAAQ